MATCLADAFLDDVARATVEVLEHVGLSHPRGEHGRIAPARCRATSTRRELPGGT
jgi:hypothetical protein